MDRAFAVAALEEALLVHSVNGQRDVIRMAAQPTTAKLRPTNSPAFIFAARWVVDIMLPSA
jgi:hypothetical protein